MQTRSSLLSLTPPLTGSQVMPRFATRHGYGLPIHHLGKSKESLFMSLNENQIRKIKIIIASGILTFLTLAILFFITKLAPFGSKSLVISDANNQYLDFFSYFKDVLSGTNSISYSFGKTLGGSNIAVFSYYLSSPFNFLLLFFDKSQLHTFFDFVVALKLSLAAMTFSFFSVNRFEPKENTHSDIYILTAMGYALCQYNIAQSSNIMWLDGVYMLPLILLQVSKIAHRKKSWSLPFIVGAAILFNWYSAGINCVFSVFWFLFEFAYYAITQKTNFRQFFQRALRYTTNMLLGVLMSAALFLPTITALRKSTRGSLHFSNLINFSFIGEFPSVIQRYSYAATSNFGSVALFCGSLAIILALFAVLYSENHRERKLFAILLSGSLLIFYWRPLYLIFSLFQWASSFYYRYSYVAIFVILFLTIIGEKALKNRNQAHLLVKIAICFSALQILLQYCKPIQDFNYTYKMIIVVLVETVLFLSVRFINFKSHQLKKLLFLTFMAVGIFDLALNANYLIKRYSVDDIKQYQVYQMTQKKLINDINTTDNTWYRISQTTTRNMKKNGTTANYNEGLGYNYASISGYTSSPDDIQRKFLDKLGYRINGVNMCITNTSILSADSLLGVKYVLSPYAIHGLMKWHAEKEAEKTIYINPYAFPVAFTYNPSKQKVRPNTNPFVYQNELYQDLFGLQEVLYSPITYHVTPRDNNHNAKIQLDMPTKSNVTTYGSIPWKREADSSIYINGKFVTKYAGWLAPSVFYVPNTNSPFCDIDVRSNSDNFDWNDCLFYALNLDVLKKYAEIANTHKADDIHIENGFISIHTKKTGERLFLSVPADDGWDILVNGKTADIELIGDCLYSIALPDEDNHITMQYHVRYLKPGIAISLISVLGYGIYLLILRKRNKDTASV